MATRPTRAKAAAVSATSVSLRKKKVSRDLAMSIKIEFPVLLARFLAILLIADGIDVTEENERIRSNAY